MHEISILRQMIASAEAELDRLDPPATPTGLTVAIGTLSGASAEAIRFAFDILSPDSRLSGCRLEIVEPKPVCVCRECGARQETETLVISCPRCGATSISLEGGDDLRLESIEVEDEGTG